ncbi:MAG: ATP-grasp domain-containing protein [Clostridia bacterium]|nr:ATP-grasp domain-containing protein [Clostridia bacterium]
MKKLVIIGANDFQNRLILKAKESGYETHAFAWEEGAVGKDNADHFYPISIIEKEEILAKCREIQPAGICSIASDLAAITVNYVAQNLGLPCNPTKYTEIQTNKYKMREALSAAGIDCPKFVLTGESINKELLKDFSFPVIVKPTDRSGSRCIMKLESAEGLEESVKNACAVSFEKKAIVEEFIEGDEYSMETITQNGKHHYLATTKKYTTGAPHFIETGHRQPSDLSEQVNEKAKRIIFKALDALHVENSAGHSEFKVDASGNIRIIEIGARMGGDCIGSDLVYLSTGNDFVKMVIDVAVGEEITIHESTGGSAQIRFIFDESDIAQMEQYQKTMPEKIVRISDIEYENSGKTVDSSTRLGYYILKS